jgi:hypothetical protein
MGMLEPDDEPQQHQQITQSCFTNDKIKLYWLIFGVIKNFLIITW